MCIVRLHTYRKLVIVGFLVGCTVYTPHSCIYTFVVEEINAVKTFSDLIRIYNMNEEYNDVKDETYTI